MSQAPRLGHMPGSFRAETCGISCSPSVACMRVWCRLYCSGRTFVGVAQQRCQTRACNGVESLKTTSSNCRYTSVTLSRWDLCPALRLAPQRCSAVGACAVGGARGARRAASSPRHNARDTRRNTQRQQKREREKEKKGFEDSTPTTHIID